jgi:hypothetical protein
MRTSFYLNALFIVFYFPLQGSIANKDTIKTGFKPRIYQTERLTVEKPKIDGSLKDVCWSTGTWSGDYTQWIPNEGAKPSQPTLVKILFDDKNIYVAIRAFDSEPGKIIRRAGRRDELTGDVAGICFDSYHDHRTGFEFDMTAAGQKADAVLTNPWNGDFNWNAVWYGKVGTEDSAWTAEMEIPLSQLRYSNEDEQVWGIHLWRWIERFQEESDWEPQTNTSPGMLYLFGELHGIRGLKKSQRIELMPYTLGKIKTYPKEAANPFANKGRNAYGNIGLDAKVGVGSNFTLDLTLNPDFGQVESDPSVMNLTAFETFFEEKRPFFLEGRNIFNVDFDDNNLFYSRRIGHSPSYSPTLEAGEYLKTPDNTTILSAVKFSGKTPKGLSVGLMQSFTANEKATIRSSSGESKVVVEPFTNYFVGRIQRDINKSNTVIGGIFTSANRFINDSYLKFMNKDAFTGGLDLLQYWKDKEYYLEAKLIGSNIQGDRSAIRNLQLSSARYYQRPDARHLSVDTTLNQLSGFGGKIKIGKGSKDHWRYSTEISWKSPGLDLNDLGYMQISDIVNQKNILSYFITKPISIFRTYKIDFDQYNNWDFNGTYLKSGGDFTLYLEFLNKWAFSNSIGYTGETLDTRLLRGGEAMLVPRAWTESLSVHTDNSKKINAELAFNSKYADNNSYKSISISPGISARLKENLRLSLNANYDVNRDNLQYVDDALVDNNTNYILGTIDQETLSLTFRIDYNITPEISLQYYGSPFATVGKFSDYKIITNPKSDKYEDRFHLISNVVRNGNNFEVFENNNEVPVYTFNNPNFNFNQMRSNLVFRWEYRPGSQIYLVWSNERTDWLNPGYAPLRSASHRLSDTAPTNIFLVKFNYWFSI